MKKNNKQLYEKLQQIGQKIFSVGFLHKNTIQLYEVLE
jgi:hypothetical protein